jgi:hypothetical protein
MQHLQQLTRGKPRAIPAAMKTIVVLSVLLLLVSMVAAQTTPVEDFMQRPFSAGKKVYLKLASGDYSIRAGRDDRIFVRWVIKKSGHHDDTMDQKVKIETFAASANVRTDDIGRDARFVIELPSHSDVYLRMRAGDVEFKGIEGNKDIRMTAGDLDIDVNPASYSKVDASVTFGDLDARPMRVSKGGIARSFDWQGSGMYSLRVKLFAGDLTLREIGSKN